MSEQILVGRYRLQGLVGHKTDLFYALDETFGRKVVVKCLPGGGTEENRLYWEQEIAKAAGLQYPHVLGVFDIVMEEEQIYLITEAIEGETLAGYVRQHAPMSLTDSVDMIRQLTRTVVEADKHGVEISIEPHSVYVNGDQQIKVIGYGPLLHGEPRVESGDKVVQMLGILLYEMLTGKAYSYFTPPQRLMQEIVDSLAMGAPQADGVQERVLKMILSALGLAGEERYPSVSYLDRDLRSLDREPDAEVSPPPVWQPPAEEAPPLRVEERQVIEETIPPTPPPTPPTPAQTALARKIEFAKKIEEEHTKKRSLMPYVGGLLVILVVIGGLWWTLGGVRTVATEDIVVPSGKEIQMPNLLNKTEEQATQILSEKEFPIDLIEWVYRPTDDTASQGKVYRQSVGANTKYVISGEKLILTVNSLPPGLTEISKEEQPAQPAPAPELPAGIVPDLKGMTQQQAEQALIKLGYHYQFFIEPGDTTPGTVFRQSVQAGTQAAPKTKVIFYISR